MMTCNISFQMTDTDVIKYVSSAHVAGSVATSETCPDQAGEDSSPPSPVRRKASRRSSTACARRFSRASTTGGGIPLEDLLATVPPSSEATTEERLTKVVQLALASTVRGVVASLEEEEVGDAATSVGVAIRQSALDSDVISSVAKKLEGGMEMGGVVVGEQVRKVREYTEQLKKEGQRWKELLTERKEMLRNVERNARAANKGEIVVTDEQRYSLSAQEKMMLKKLPNYKAALEQLAGHEDKVELSARNVATQAARLKRNLEMAEGNLGLSVRKLIKRADTVGGRIEELESVPGLFFEDIPGKLSKTEYEEICKEH